MLWWHCSRMPPIGQNHDNILWEHCRVAVGGWTYPLISRGRFVSVTAARRRRCLILGRIEVWIPDNVSNMLKWQIGHHGLSSARYLHLKIRNITLVSKPVCCRQISRFQADEFTCVDSAKHSQRRTISAIIVPSARLIEGLHVIIALRMSSRTRHWPYYLTQTAFFVFKRTAPTLTAHLIRLMNTTFQLEYPFPRSSHLHANTDLGQLCWNSVTRI